jgi:hypothetical protein
MHSNSFDQFSKALGAADSRRRFLRVIAGGLFAAVAGAGTQSRHAAAENRRCDIWNSCPGWQTCEHGYCVPNETSMKCVSGCQSLKDQCRWQKCDPILDPVKREECIDGCRKDVKLCCAYCYPGASC